MKTGIKGLMRKYVGFFGMLMRPSVRIFNYLLTGVKNLQIQDHTCVFGEYGPVCVCVFVCVREREARSPSSCPNGVPTTLPATDLHSREIEEARERWSDLGEGGYG